MSVLSWRRKKGKGQAMIDLSDKKQVQALKTNIHAVFDTPQGKEVMLFLEELGGWTPNIMDPMDTNSIISRDANRRLIGTIKTIMTLNPDQIAALAGNEDQ